MPGPFSFILIIKSVMLTFSKPLYLLVGPSFDECHKGCNPGDGGGGQIKRVSRRPRVDGNITVEDFRPEIPRSRGICGEYCCKTCGQLILSILIYRVQQDLWDTHWESIFFSNGQHWQLPNNYLISRSPYDCNFPPDRIKLFINLTHRQFRIG